MATVMLSMHSKQPKRGMVSCEKGYIEVMEYPRAWEAKIVDAETGEIQVIKAGAHEDALAYELLIWKRRLRGCFLYASGLYKGCNGSDDGV